jgi:hypothetical protein
VSVKYQERWLDAALSPCRLAQLLDRQTKACTQQVIVRLESASRRYPLGTVLVMEIIEDRFRDNAVTIRNPMAQEHRCDTGEW